MKSARIFAATKLLLATVVFATLTSGMAAAQRTVRGTFELKDQTRWGAAVLAPGSYTISFDSVNLPSRGIIRSRDGKIVAMVSTSITGDPSSQKSFLFVTGTGSQRQVRFLNLPLLGVSLDYESLTPAENEQFSKHLKENTVPVTVATR